MNAYVRFSGALPGILLGFTMCFPLAARAQTLSATEFQQTKLVASQEPVVLDVDIESGQLQILYSHDGEVSLSVSMPDSLSVRSGRDPALPLFEQNGNHLTVRALGVKGEQKNKTPHYRLDVPYRTEVVSHVGNGSQEISGIMGPVRAVTQSGNTRVSYVSQDVAATAEKGNLDLEVIGGRIQARVRRGNISCTRAAQGIEAESERGDITLVAVGPSTAKVKDGSGRIEVSGARAKFLGSTDAGEIHVKAALHDDWKMNSQSGSIRIELPPNSSFLLDASTEAGEILVDRDDLEKADAGVRHIHQTVNDGRKHIDLHTDSGEVAIR